MQQLRCCAGFNPVSVIPFLGEPGQVSLTLYDSVYLLDRNSCISQTEMSIAKITSLTVCEAHKYPVMVAMNLINKWLIIFNEQVKGKEYSITQRSVSRYLLFYVFHLSN